jgi:SAM-dependent methyltransferase
MQEWSLGGSGRNSETAASQPVGHSGEHAFLGKFIWSRIPPRADPVTTVSKTAERIRWAVDQLPWQDRGLVLEVGCGGGHAVAMLCARRDIGHITAIDRVAAQVREARERNRECIEAGRAAIEQCAMEDAPGRLGDTRFDTLLAINVNGFWTSPASSLAAAAELLHAKSRAYLVFEPPSASGLRRIERALDAAFEELGWTRHDLRTATVDGAACICVIASPP